MAIAPTTAVRARTRPGNPGTQTGGGASNAPDTSWMKTGASARAAAEAEIVRQREAAERRASGLYMPYRFWMGTGESKEVIVLDHEPGPRIYEHNLQDNHGKWSIYEGCPKEWEPCPVCDKFKESYYVMFLTVIDFTPFVVKRGTPQEQTINFSRKLMPVKAEEMGFFDRQFERKGTLRGLHLQMSRDTQQSPRIGRPEIVLGLPDNPDFNGWHPEAAIIESFGSAEVKSEDGSKIVRPVNVDCFAFDYGRLFKRPSGEDLRKRYGGTAPAGSRQDRRDEWGDQGGRDAAPRSGGVSAGNGVPADLDDDIPF